MIQQSLLTSLATQCDFSKTGAIIAMPQTKPFIRTWMAIEFCLPLAKHFATPHIDFALPYQDKENYYKYAVKTSVVEACERKYASKADLCLSSSNQHHWIEFHALHQADLNSSRERHKLYNDVKRVRTLRQTISGEDIILLIALWGRFNSEEIKFFTPLDNNKQCAYVLDTSLTGSTQVARLSHMKREGEPRLLLIAV